MEKHGVNSNAAIRPDGSTLVIAVSVLALSLVVVPAGWSAKSSWVVYPNHPLHLSVTVSTYTSREVKGTNQLFTRAQLSLAPYTNADNRTRHKCACATENDQAEHLQTHVRNLGYELLPAKFAAHPAVG